MKVKEIMDKEFIVVSAGDKVVDVSIKMENTRKFTTPVVDDDMKLVGWVTSFDVMRGLREGLERVSDIMHPTEEIVYVNENDPARLAVLETAHNKLVSIPVLDDDGRVVGVVRSFDIVETLSQLYEIKVSKIFEAMNQELKGVSWDELMEAAATITRRRTGKRIKPAEYEERIKNSTSGRLYGLRGALRSSSLAL